MSLTFNDYPFLARLGLSETNHGCFDGSEWFGNGATVDTVCPSTGLPVAKTVEGNMEDLTKVTAKMKDAQEKWAAVPAPKRGDIVRQIGDALREKCDDLGAVISMEMGKIKSEGVGEVVETIDICGLAAGLSRSMAGQVVPSERPDHVLYETWRPIGLQGRGIAVLTAFNFPNAVFGWNAAIALVTGNCIIWKGAPSANLISIATTKVIQEVFERNGVPPGVLTLIQGDGPTVGNAIVSDESFPLVSFTGSSRVGTIVAQEVAKNVGRRHLLELSGNNASIIMPDADLDIAIKQSVFGAVGTAGQRCTSLRRLYAHESVYDEVVSKMVQAYGSIKPGSPLEDGVILGPVHNQQAVDIYTNAIDRAVKAGGKVLIGGKRYDMPGFFVEPTIIEMDPDADMVNEEFFVPIVFVFKFSSYEEAIKRNNAVPMGLSSCLYTKDIRLMHRFMGSGPDSADTGLRNINSGTSGAEIGLAFGGNKLTGGGREAGSDSWKQYMTRSTSCVSYSEQVILAQGVNFD